MCGMGLSALLAPLTLAVHAQPEAMQLLVHTVN